MKPSPQAPKAQDLLTSEEAAARIRVCERKLRELRKSGLIAYVAVTERKIMYRPEDCAEYLASRLRRDDPCSTPRQSGKPRPDTPRRPRPMKGRRSGNVISFEELARKRGW